VAVGLREGACGAFAGETEHYALMLGLSVFLSCIKSSEYTYVQQDNTTWRCPIQQMDLAWEAKDVFNPAAVVNDGIIHVLYRAEDHVCVLVQRS
jgi:hypothetical protein